MFTGIVQGMAEVSSIEDQHVQDEAGKSRLTLRRLTLALPSGLENNIELGASIATNGCCLTVAKVDGRFAQFDLMQETLTKTSLDSLVVGDTVNVERAAKFGDEIGGHNVSGHITQAVTVRSVDSQNSTDGGMQKTIWFDVPSQWMKYILPKGFVALDGCSLTVGDIDENGFCVFLIPETLSRTCFGHRQVGSLINLEVDPQTQAIVDTVERVMAQQTSVLS